MLVLGFAEPRDTGVSCCVCATRGGGKWGHPCGLRGRGGGAWCLLWGTWFSDGTGLASPGGWWWDRGPAGSYRRQKGGRRGAEGSPSERPPHPPTPGETDGCSGLADVTLGGQEVVFPLLWRGLIPVVWALMKLAERLPLQVFGACVTRRGPGVCAGGWGLHASQLGVICPLVAHDTAASCP